MASRQSSADLCFNLEFAFQEERAEGKGRAGIGSVLSSHTVPPRHHRPCPLLGVPGVTWTRFWLPSSSQNARITWHCHHRALCAPSGFIGDTAGIKLKVSKAPGGHAGGQGRKGNRGVMPELLGHLLACSPEGEKGEVWGWCCGSGLAAGWVHPGAPSSGQRCLCGVEMCRTRKGWPELILVVFGDELGRGHRVAQIKNLCELLHVKGAWGERKKGVSRAGEGSSHVQLLLCPKPHPAHPRRPQGQRGVTGTPALSTLGYRGLDPLLPPDLWRKPS